MVTKTYGELNVVSNSENDKNRPFFYERVFSHCSHKHHKTKQHVEAVGNNLF